MPLANAATYPLWANLAIVLAAGIVIWIFGKRLAHDVDAVAVRQRLDHAFAGMLLLGGITSLPELANTVTSASIGSPELGINNLLGSAAINVLLLAVADAIVGRKAVTAIVARPSTMIMAALCMILLVVIAVAIIVGDTAVAGVGIGSMTTGILALACFWLSAGHDGRSRWKLEGQRRTTGAAAPPKPAAPTAALWSRICVSGILIAASGYALSQTGDAISEQTGLTSSAVGFGLIGTLTSLPELVTILAALRLCRPEMAFGQVLGTNFVNLSLIPLSDAVYGGDPVLGTLGTFETLSALLGAVLIGAFLVGLIEHRDRTIGRMGIDSAAVIALFGTGVAMLANL